MADPPNTSYRTAAFLHWANLAVLAAGGVAGAIIDPTIWLALVPIETGVLWLLPDLPPFRAGVDARREAGEVERERAYYLDQLWGLRPRQHSSVWARMAAALVQSPDEDMDARVIRRGSLEFANYMEMRAIVEKLRELVNVRGVKLSSADLGRLEQITIGYLRLLIACAPLEQALAHAAPEQLQEEIDTIERQLPGAESSVRAALQESMRLKQAELSRIPKIAATLELMRTRAGAIVQQLRNIQGQILSDPARDVNSMLDEMVERREMLADPLKDLANDQMLAEFLNTPRAASKAPPWPPRPPPPPRPTAAGSVEAPWKGRLGKASPSRFPRSPMRQGRATLRGAGLCVIHRTFPCQPRSPRDHPPPVLHGERHVHVATAVVLHRRQPLPHRTRGLQDGRCLHRGGGAH
jgi:hypothetical protein